MYICTHAYSHVYAIGGEVEAEDDSAVSRDELHSSRLVYRAHAERKVLLLTCSSPSTGTEQAEY